MNSVRESKVAYYWAIYMGGIKQGNHPSRGFYELQICTHFATKIPHKPYYGVLENELRAFKLIKVNEEHSAFPIAMEIFNKAPNRLEDLHLDKSNFIVFPKEENHEKQKLSQEKWIQTEIDLGPSTYNWD
ncbi:MAG: hypothetical protein PHH83_01735 [Patescibacteria group bacterium]|nr:hypothetical protein [Patescibacteria group bacterium]